MGNSNSTLSDSDDGNNGKKLPLQLRPPPRREHHHQQKLKKQIPGTPTVLIMGRPSSGKATMLAQCEGLDGLYCIGESDGRTDESKYKELATYLISILRKLIVFYCVKSHHNLKVVSSDNIRNVMSLMMKMDRDLEWLNPSYLDINDTKDYLEFWPAPRRVKFHPNFNEEDYRTKTPSYKIKYIDLIALSQEPFIVEMLPFGVGNLHPTLNENFSYFWPGLAEKFFLNRSFPTSQSSKCSLPDNNANNPLDPSEREEESSSNGTSPEQLVHQENTSQPSTVSSESLDQPVKRSVTPDLITCETFLRMYRSNDRCGKKGFYGKSIVKTQNDQNGQKGQNGQNGLNDQNGQSTTKKNPLPALMTIHVEDNFSRPDRSLRKKTTVILYMISLTDYNSELLDSNGVRCDYEASIREFVETVTMSGFSGKRDPYGKVSVILCLNKYDLFKEKLKLYPFRDSHPDYQGDNDDHDEIVHWIVNKYLDRLDDSNSVFKINREQCQVKIVDALDHDQVMKLYTEIYQSHKKLL